MGHFRPLSLLLSFQKIWQYISNIKFADDWIGTMDFWCRKRQLNQLSHTQSLTLNCMKLKSSLHVLLESLHRADDVIRDVTVRASRVKRPPVCVNVVAVLQRATSYLRRVENVVDEVSEGDVGVEPDLNVGNLWEVWRVVLITYFVDVSGNESEKVGSFLCNVKFDIMLQTT